MTQRSLAALFAAFVACALAFVLGGTAAPAVGQEPAPMLALPMLAPPTLAPPMLVEQPLVPVAPELAPSDLDPDPLQGGCGDRRCDPPEDCHSCPGDCGSCCGDHHCEPPEDRNSCPSDCN